MSHVPVETVEEDAADLQFPKGKQYMNRIFFSFEYIKIPYVFLKAHSQEAIETDTEHIIIILILIRYIHAISRD